MKQNHRLLSLVVLLLLSFLAACVGQEGENTRASNTRGDRNEGIPSTTTQPITSTTTTTTTTTTTVTLTTQPITSTTTTTVTSTTQPITSTTTTTTVPTTSTPTTTVPIHRVSVDSEGVQGNSLSLSPAISSDGRFVAFESSATNLITGMTHSNGDIFVHDRETGLTGLASFDSAGFQGDGRSSSPAIASDGPLFILAFASGASNFVAGGDTNSFAGDVFVQGGSGIKHISVNANGVQGNDDSFSPEISSDGRFVAFSSSASNLVAGDMDTNSDVFVYDGATGSIELVSVNSVGVKGNGFSSFPAISSDGRFVAFSSSASNLVEGDTNFDDDIFVRDRATGSTTRVPVNPEGTTNHSVFPAISSDGRFVAFGFDVSNLVNGVAVTRRNVFVHDRATGSTTRVSVNSAGVQGNGSSFLPAISSDGRFVVFLSDASNLVEDDTNNKRDVFVHDRATGSTRRVSVNSAGVQGNDGSFSPAISGDGRFVAFSSDASNLVESDTNSADDIFVTMNPLFP